jgi:hypothetical protein
LCGMGKLFESLPMNCAVRGSYLSKDAGEAS